MRQMKISKILNTLVTIIIVSVVLLVVVSFLPIPGNYKLLIVESGSMEPAIHTGSVVIVKPAESYQAKDIVTFADKGKGKTTTHRIVDMEVAAGITYFITKGDANNAEDTNRVSESKVVGKVLTSIPYVGFILAFAKTTLGFILLVIVPCAIIIFEETGKIFKEMKLSKKKKSESENTDSEKNNSIIETTDSGQNPEL